MEPPVGRDALSEASCSSIPMSSRSSSLAPPCCGGSGGIATLKRVLAAASSAAACSAAASSAAASSAAACSAAASSAAASSAAARSAAARSAAARSAAAEAASASAASRAAARSTTMIAASDAARASSISIQLRLRWLSTAGPITRSQTAKLLRWRFTNCAYAVGCATAYAVCEVCVTRVEQANTA
eukprot:scaffold107324_cov60-Phaeocystis_antarctica.AAC.1